ncbi:hypothetical protein ACNVED_10690 [Legionella sp. D16C41]|uniref:hypothetical protein n=1 Tax=Legionella sp. D16C41 TaxID=3402688 RepID=UPI003AF97D52
MIRRYILAVILIFLSKVTTSTAPKLEEYAPPSLADHVHLSLSKDPIDGGWLPDLLGLPNDEQLATSIKQANDVVREEQDKQCSAIDSNLRLLIFQHFIIQQYIANAQNIYFDEHIAQQWAHVLAMIVKESSGDSTSITDMKGHSLSTYNSETNLEHWRKILTLTKQKYIHFTYQTNFGLAQTSADRLFNAFRLAQNEFYDTALLEGKEGAATPRKVKLNTAIAIRRLIWFYQDFAQGRISQIDRRLHQSEINSPEFFFQYEKGLEKAVIYCGTRFMFLESQLKKGLLKDAVSSIAYCKLGNSSRGYGLHEMDQQCFAQWVTLCPALNIDIAILTPLNYFATRGEKPVCTETFKKLINKKSSGDKQSS